MIIKKIVEGMDVILKIVFYFDNKNMNKYKYLSYSKYLEEACFATEN